MAGPPTYKKLWPCAKQHPYMDVKTPPLPSSLSLPIPPVSPPSTQPTFLPSPFPTTMPTPPLPTHLPHLPPFVELRCWTTAAFLARALEEFPYLPATAPTHPPGNDTTTYHPLRAAALPPLAFFNARAAWLARWRDGGTRAAAARCCAALPYAFARARAPSPPRRAPPARCVVVARAARCACTVLR